MHGNAETPIRTPAGKGTVARGYSPCARIARLGLLVPVASVTARSLCAGLGDRRVPGRR